MAADFANIAVTLGLEDSDKLSDQVVARNLVLQWLSMSTEKSRHNLSTQDLSLAGVRWLLIFDNAESLSDLRDYWPVSGNGSIIITSRDPLAKTQAYFHSPQGVDLEPFSTTESAKWLRKLTRLDNTVDNIEASEEIVEKLSNLPLAIAQTAGAILRQDLSFKEFLEFYRSEQFRADLYQSEYGGFQRPMWTVFAFKDLSPEAAAVMNVLAFFDPDSIPETTLTGVISKSKSAGIKLEGFPKTSISFVNARSELTRSSLVRRNVNSRELTLHRIVQDAALSSMDSTTLLASFETAIYLINESWFFLSDNGGHDYDPERWKQCEPLLPHILHMSTRYHMSQTIQDVSDYNYAFGRLISDAGW